MAQTRGSYSPEQTEDRINQHSGGRGRPRTTDPRVNLGAAVPIDLRDALDMVTSNRSAYVERLLLSDPEVFEAWSQIKLEKSGDGAAEVAAVARTFGRAVPASLEEPPAPSNEVEERAQGEDSLTVSR